MTQPMLSPRAFDGMRLPWSWCTRCQRVYATGTSREIRFKADSLHPHPAILHLCPYEDCTGSTNRNGWLWSTILLQHPEYPAQPEPNVIYPR